MLGTRPALTNLDVATEVGTRLSSVFGLIDSAVRMSPMMARFAKMYPDLWKKLRNSVLRQCLGPERFARLEATLMKADDRRMPATVDDELEDDPPMDVDDPALKALPRAAAFNPEADQARFQIAEALDAAVSDAKLEFDS